MMRALRSLAAGALAITLSLAVIGAGAYVAAGWVP
jgi:hypothetical protein